MIKKGKIIIFFLLLNNYPFAQQITPINAIKLDKYECGCWYHIYTFSNYYMSLADSASFWMLNVLDIKNQSFYNIDKY